MKLKKCIICYKPHTRQSRATCSTYCETKKLTKGDKWAKRINDKYTNQNKG